MSSPLDQTVIAEIKRFAAFTPAELKQLAAITHDDITTINAQLQRATDLSADQLARGRMLYQDFVTALASGAARPEQGILRDKNFRLCLIAGTMIESDDMLALSTAYQAQDWPAFMTALKSVNQHYEAQAALYHHAVSMGDNAQDLYNMRGSVAASIATVAHFRLLAVADAPVSVVSALWSNASKQSREIFAPSLRRLAKARGDADVSGVIKTALKGIKPATPPAAKQDQSRVEIEAALKALADKMIVQEIGKLKDGAFDVHTGIRGTYEKMFGGMDKLSLSFGKATLDRHFERLLDRLATGSRDFGGVDIEKAAMHCMVAQMEARYRVSKAYQAKDWQGFCIESVELAKSIGDLLTVLDVSAQQRPADKQLRAEIDLSIIDAEKDNKFFQLHMILEAPVQAITYVWSRERKEDVAMYAKMMKQLADARGDAEVSKAVDELIASAKPAKAAKPKAPRAPKK